MLVPPYLGTCAGQDGSTLGTHIKKHKCQGVKRGLLSSTYLYNLTSWSPIYNTSFKTYLLPGSNICAIWLFYTTNSLDISLHLVSSASEIPSLGNHSETKKFLQPLILWRFLADVCDMWGWLISSQLLTPSGNSWAKSPISPQPTSVKERTWARHCPAVQIRLMKLLSGLGSDVPSAGGCWWHSPFLKGCSFLAAPHSTRDLSSPTRDWTHVPCSGSVGS